MTSTAANPHETLAHLRQSSPAHQIPIGPTAVGWLITRYADVKRALNDPRLSKQALSQRTNGGSPFPVDVRKAMSEHMLNFDPPEHTRLRRLVSASFTARRVEALRPRIEQLTDDLLAGLDGRDTVDLIDDFAFPLPFTVICELIGVPEIDREAFRGWSNTMVAGPAAPPEQMYQAVAATADYVADLIGRKRAEPDDALLSSLIQASDAGAGLTADELSSVVFLLLLAGHETTVNLIGNAVYVLLQRPSMAADLRADPTLVPDAIEEILRYESPVKSSTLRLTTEPVTYGDITIPADEIVIISLLSANRDGDAFIAADEFDPTRTDAGGHVAFGHGIHYCLGAPLARLESQIAVSALLRRYPELRSAVPLDELDWRPGILMHGVTRLPVTLR
ncbi:cytochrome P450 [Hamadaea flava]|uniref:Cytochrome P450 n=1 Tax=Hamadaea flava TaxID=1742688 RepID=A0ABV8M1N1_9ACTN|nr:cytochrome P450 [Hamadaea flava]MCP2326752.1 cytochrome P450 [Hamadaea flava]